MEFTCIYVYIIALIVQEILFLLSYYLVPFNKQNI